MKAIHNQCVRFGERREQVDFITYVCCYLPPANVLSLRFRAVNLVASEG